MTKEKLEQTINEYEHIIQVAYANEPIKAAKMVSDAYLPSIIDLKNEVEKISKMERAAPDMLKLLNEVYSMANRKVFPTEKELYKLALKTNKLIEKATQ